MPRFFLPPKEKLIETLYAIDLRTEIERFEESKAFTTKSVYLKESFFNKLRDEEFEILATAVQIAATKDGTVIPYEDAERQIARCDVNLFPIYDIDLNSGKLSHFLELVDKHPFPEELGLLPNQYDKSLHFYLGYANGGREFNVVIVPAFENIQGKNVPDPYIEQHSFTDQNPFFAFIIHSGNFEVSYDQPFCKELVIKKDTIPNNIPGVFPTQVVSFSFKTFMEFKANLEKKPAKFHLRFGRLDNSNYLTVILSFLNSKGLGPIVSSITTPSSQGVCFDQGDLIPPPPVGGWDSVFY